MVTGETPMNSSRSLAGQVLVGDEQTEADTLRQPPHYRVGALTDLEGGEDPSFTSHRQR